MIRRYMLLVVIVLLMSSFPMINPQPSLPHTIWGIVEDEYGNGINGANVTLVNQRTGEELYNISYYDQFVGNGTYIFNLADLPSGWEDGDNVSIYAYKEGVGYGETWIIVDASVGYQRVDITLLSDIYPPVTVIGFGSPHYGNYITENTLIYLNATDDSSGVNKTYYRIWNGSWSSWIEYTGAFTIEDECTHYIEFYSIDNLGNTEPINNVTVYVDNSPPIANAGNDKEGFIGQLLQFNTSLSYDEKSGIANYTWDFGDGNYGYGEIVYHSYNESGIYTVVLTVTDNLEFYSIDTINVTIYENFTFELKTGWNLICLPLNTTYKTAEELGQAIGADTVVAWDAISQQWITHPVGGPNNFELELGEAYFVHVMSDIMFQIHGLPYNVNYTLYLGWNFIGWFSKDNTTAEELGQAIEADTVVAWNAVTQQWITHPVGGPGNFVIVRGIGVAVHIFSS